ncbi:MAG: response regulator transcription factor [Chloroflexi bacterium]|nr:response regulator transcription factor [Chloroflexota bacterium]
MTRILIVDDDELIADSLSYSLRLEGYETRSVGLGAQALDALSAFSPDLVVLDLNLPDINGMEVCRQMRIRGTIPVIMLTARDDEIDRVMGLEVGADDYLTKPFAFRELLARIRALLRRVQFDQQEQTPSLINIGAITLDIKGRRILRYNNEIEVSAREFDLLELLMQNAGTALSREQLLDQVWGQDWVGDHRTLNVHVRWLRVKLEEDPASPLLIQTVRGYGYRFAGPEELR